MQSRRNALLFSLLAAILAFEPQSSFAARKSSSPEYQEPHQNLFEWSPLVQQIQELLNEFDLLAHNADGKLTRETQRAIRAYQKQSNIPVDGAPTKALLDHMVRIGRVGALKQKLARAREVQIMKARHALISNPATSDLVVSQISRDAVATTVKPDMCLRAPTVDCLLDGALGAAISITRDDYRDWALRDVIRAFARAGRTDEARENIKRLTDLRLILVSLRETATALAKAGKLDAANTMTATIPDDWNRARALLAIVQSEGSNPATIDSLLELLPLVEDRVSAVDTLAELAVFLANNGATARAVTAISDFENQLNDEIPPDIQRITLAAIATAYARIGQSDEALQTLDRIGDTGRDHIALAEAAGQLAKNNKLAAAIATADRLRTPQLFVLAMTKIASAQVQLGNHEAARASLERAYAASLDIERPFAAETAQARIAKVWSEISDYSRAMNTIDKIKNNALKAQTLWRLTIRNSEAPQPEEETSFFSNAVSATQRIESAFDRAATLARAATEFIEAKKYGHARRVFDMAILETHSIRNDWWRARIFSLLATVLGEI